MYRSLSAMGELFGRMVKGLGGAIIQFYDEVNKKRGKQWEVSRTIPLTTVGQKVYSVIHVGSLPVDLKDRILGATGGGVIGRAYRIQASDVSFTGPPDLWQNYHSKVFGQPLTKVYPQSSVTFLTNLTELAITANKMHADIHAITTTQNQGKGFTPSPFGGNHLLWIDDYVLLEIESFDSSQTATAKLNIYEGELDFYPDGVSL